MLQICNLEVAIHVFLSYNAISIDRLRYFDASFSMVLGFSFQFGDPWISLLIHVLFWSDLL